MMTIPYQFQHLELPTTLLPATYVYTWPCQHCGTCTSGHAHIVACVIIIIMVIFKCYFSREHIAISLKNGVNIELGKTDR